MSANTMQTFEHVLEIGVGETGTIDFRFPKNRRQTFKVTLEAADRESGTVALLLDNLTRGYEMSLYTEGDEEEPWNPLLPDPRGAIRATLDLNAAQRIGIDSDDQFPHSLHLVGGQWRGERLRLTFCETA